jgi:hypothetical protein
MSLRPFTRDLDMMRNDTKAAIALTAAALLSGCASGGSVFTNPNTPKPFTTWENYVTAVISEFPGAMRTGVGYSVTGSDITPAISPFFVNDGASAIVGFDANRKFRTLSLFQTGFDLPSFDTSPNSFSTLAAIGEPGFDFATINPLFAGQSPFVSTPTRGIAFAANPFVLGWDYQSFGVWDLPSVFGPSISVATFGALTPASAVPTSGAPTFTGKLGGLYVSTAGQGSVAFADVTVIANFSMQSLNFASTGTVTTRDLAATIPAPNLNLGGTLTYSPSSNTFSGTLTNAGGTMSGTSTGRYYGPAGQELGGVFTLRSPTTVETFTGGYGAKQ